MLNVVVTGDKSYKGSHLENLPTSPGVAAPGRLAALTTQARGELIERPGHRRVGKEAEEGKKNTCIDKRHIRSRDKEVEEETAGRKRVEADSTGGADGAVEGKQAATSGCQSQFQHTRSHTPCACCVTHSDISEIKPQGDETNLHIHPRCWLGGGERKTAIFS